MEYEIDIYNVQNEEVVATTSASRPASLTQPTTAATAADLPPDHPLLSSLQANDDFIEVLGRDPSLMASAWSALMSARAPSTLRAYSNALRRFSEFCSAADFDFPRFAPDALLQYVLNLVKSGASFSVFANLKPAISLIDTALQRPSSFTNLIDLLIAGAKRSRRIAAGPVKKAAPLPVQHILALLDKHITPYLDNINLVPAAIFRTLVRLLVEYHTLCRLACYRLLRAKHVEIVGQDLVITFVGSKNDRFHNGQASCLVATGSQYCPVRLLRLYFRRFGLQFGAAAGDDSFLLFQLRRSAADTLPVVSRALSYSGATDDLRRLLRGIGVDPTSITDKSVKMAGVTAAFQGGATTEEVMHIGRWRTPEIPLQYKLNSFLFKKRVASLVPPVDMAP
jgi:hypothetical protein